MRQSLAIAQKRSPGSLDLARMFTSMSGLEDERGDLLQTESYERQALSIREKLAPDGIEYAGSLNNLAVVAVKRGIQPGRSVASEGVGGLGEARSGWLWRRCCPQQCRQACAAHWRHSESRSQFSTVSGDLGNSGAKQPRRCR